MVAAQYELPFVFGTLRFTGIQGGDDALAADRPRMVALSAQMIDAWTSFARTGNPNSRRTIDRPEWPAYQAPRRATMIWDIPASVVDAPPERRTRCLGRLHVRTSHAERRLSPVIQIRRPVGDPA